MPADAPVTSAIGRVITDALVARAPIPAWLTPGLSWERTSLPFTTIRCAALCLGWHAKNVIVGLRRGGR